MAQEGRVGYRHEIMGPRGTISMHTFRKDLDVLLHCCEYVTPLELERWNAGRLKPHAGRWAAGTVGSFDRGLGLDISDAARGTPDAEKATARAAVRSGSAFTLSSLSNMSMEAGFTSSYYGRSNTGS